MSLRQPLWPRRGTSTKERSRDIELRVKGEDPLSHRYHQHARSAAGRSIRPTACADSSTWPTAADQPQQPRLRLRSGGATRQSHPPLRVRHRCSTSLFDILELAHNSNSRRGLVGTPGGTQTPNFLIRTSPSRVHKRPQPSTQPKTEGLRFHRRPQPSTAIRSEWLPTWLPRCIRG